MCVFNFSILYNLTHFGSPSGSKWGKKGQKGHKLIIAVKMAKRSMSFGIEKIFGTRNSMVKSDFDKM